MSPLRPVTPAGHLARLLGAIHDRLESGSAGSDTPALLADLRLACELAAGLDNYPEAVTSPASPALRSLAETTVATDWHELRSRSQAAGTGGSQQVPAWEAEMLSGQAEGELLALLVHATRAVRVLEIGMFTGYASLAMAEHLPEHGAVVACELDPLVADVARSTFARHPAGDRIDVRVGPADRTLAVLAQEVADGAAGPFDVVFVDADKAGYRGYVETVLDAGLLASHGVLAVDNTMLQGEPWLSDDASARLASGGQANGADIAAFNSWLAAEPRLRHVLVPLRDGVTLARLAAPSEGS